MRPSSLPILALLAVLVLGLTAIPCAAQETDPTEHEADFPAPIDAAMEAQAAEQSKAAQEEEEKKGPGFWKKVFRGYADSPTGQTGTAAEGEWDYAEGVPESLKRVQSILRAGPVKDDPKARFYMDLVENDRATPAQMATFGSYLTEKGIHSAAIEYYLLAVRRDPTNPLLWLNTGSVYRLLGEDSKAAGAYLRSVELDPFIAEAHYNLGAAYDALNEYDKAIDEYMIALTLDPKLGDVRHNPQVVNNARMDVVQLLLYQRQLGTRGLPLVEIEAD
jgi:tetratricopeptide (TPR) repeat protein